MVDTAEALVESFTSVSFEPTAAPGHARAVFTAENATTYVVEARYAPSAAALIRSGTGYGTVTDDSERNFALSLRRIQENSDLSWGEIARVLGVSRRTVHNWLTAARLSGENARRVAALYRAVTRELTEVPRTRARDHLLAPGPDGSTRLATITRDLRAQYPRGRQVASGVQILRASSTDNNDPMITGGIDGDAEVIEADDVLSDQ